MSPHSGTQAGRIAPKWKQFFLNILLKYDIWQIYSYSIAQNMPLINAPDHKGKD